MEDKCSDISEPKQGTILAKIHVTINFSKTTLDRFKKLQDIKKTSVGLAEEAWKKAKAANENIPSHLKTKITFEVSSKLTFIGIMSREEKNDLLKILPNNKSYYNAIGALFEISQISFKLEGGYLFFSEHKENLNKKLTSSSKTFFEKNFKNLDITKDQPPDVKVYSSHAGCWDVIVNILCGVASAAIYENRKEFFKELEILTNKFRQTVIEPLRERIKELLKSETDSYHIQFSLPKEPIDINVEIDTSPLSSLISTDISELIQLMFVGLMGANKEIEKVLKEFHEKHNKPSSNFLFCEYLVHKPLHKLDKSLNKQSHKELVKERKKNTWEISPFAERLARESLVMIRPKDVDNHLNGETNEKRLEFRRSTDEDIAQTNILIRMIDTLYTQYIYEYWEENDNELEQRCSLKFEQEFDLESDKPFFAFTQEYINDLDKNDGNSRLRRKLQYIHQESKKSFYLLHGLFWPHIENLRNEESITSFFIPIASSQVFYGNLFVCVPHFDYNKDKEILKELASDLNKCVKKHYVPALALIHERFFEELVGKENGTISKKDLLRSYELTYNRNKIAECISPICRSINKVGSSLITEGDISNWDALLLEIQGDANKLTTKLLTSKLQGHNWSETSKTPLTVEEKEDIVAAFNAIKDNLTFYNNEVFGKGINLSPEVQKELNDLKEILEESGELKNEYDLSDSQKEDIKWFNITILKNLFPQILSKSQIEHCYQCTHFDWEKSSDNTVEKYLHKLWQDRRTRFTDKEIKESLFFQDRLYTDPTMLDVLERFLKPSKARLKNLPSILVVASPGAGKEDIPKLLKFFTDYYDKGKTYKINMASLKPDAIVPMAMAGGEIRNEKDTDYEYKGAELHFHKTTTDKLEGILQKIRKETHEEFEKFIKDELPNKIKVYIDYFENRKGIIKDKLIEAIKKEIRKKEEERYAKKGLLDILKTNNFHFVSYNQKLDWQQKTEIKKIFTEETIEENIIEELEREQRRLVNEIDAKGRETRKLNEEEEELEKKLKMLGENGEIKGLKISSIEKLSSKAKRLLKELFGGFPTIVLDELNSMNIESQGVLLRFLENSEIMPIGGIEDKMVIDGKAVVDKEYQKFLTDFLVVGLMNEEPEEITRERAIQFLKKEGYIGGLLGDLLYEHIIKIRRLRPDLKARMMRNGIIRIPKLAEHRADIPHTFYNFLHRDKRDYFPNSEIRITMDALELLMSPELEWPENFRLLETLTKKAEEIICEDYKDKDDKFIIVREKHIREAMKEIDMIQESENKKEK